MIEIYFVNDAGDTLIRAQSESVPRIGELVTIRRVHFDKTSPPLAVTSFRVLDVEWPVAASPHGGHYLQVSVTLEEQDSE